MRRRRLHRIVFGLAGVYNISWGLFAAIDPQWLFRFANMPLMVHPPIYQAMGMVVGVYGVLYLEIARRPEHGWLMAAVGWVGKILGPIGMLQLVLSGQWPPAALVLNLTNDLIWLPFFTVYLWDAWPMFRHSLTKEDA